jgi:uncharacterized protein
MKKKLLLSIVALLLIGSMAMYAFNRQPPAETRFSGAYRFDDGTLMMITPREGAILRFKKMNGETGALWPGKEADEYEGGDGWAEHEPVTNRVRFERDPRGQIAGLTWHRTEQGTATDLKAARLPLREEIVTFRSGDLTLRGKLVLPAGTGPFAVVVPVHGSEKHSAVDQYSDPYMNAAHGIAAFVYDKRGTGGSEGEYTANFDVLSNDTVAAVKYLRTRNEVDGDKIHLAGFSQGGWIAPLAALKDGNIRTVFVGFGVAVPVLGEDRWGYVYAFQQKGFGEQEIAEMDSIAAILSDILDRGQDRWDDFHQAVAVAKSKPWFETAKHSDSLFGMILGADMPLWMARPYMWWKYGRADVPFIDRLYDPMQTLAKLDTPSFWVFGGQDSSAPTQWSVDELERLKAAGKPIEYFVYPEAEHGIIRFEQKPDGERRLLGFEDGYFQQQVAWFRRHSGL